MFPAQPRREWKSLLYNSAYSAHIYILDHRPSACRVYLSNICAVRTLSQQKNKAKQSKAGKKARAFTMSQVTMCATAYPSQTTKKENKTPSSHVPLSPKELCGQFDPSDIQQQQPCPASNSIEREIFCSIHEELLLYKIAIEALVSSILGIFSFSFVVFCFSFACIYRSNSLSHSP